VISRSTCHCSVRRVRRPTRTGTPAADGEEDHRDESEQGNENGRTIGFDRPATLRQAGNHWFDRDHYGAGWTTVFPSRVTAVCASSLPLIDAPVWNEIAVADRMTPLNCAVVPTSALVTCQKTFLGSARRHDVRGAAELRSCATWKIPSRSRRSQVRQDQGPFPAVDTGTSVIPPMFLRRAR
jgi:hypothetical protein